MRVQTLATLAAPVLWFAPTEPLRTDGLPPPHALPFDDSNDGPAVYYRLRALKPVSPKDFTFRRDHPLRLQELRSVHLEFFFYYSRDEGFGSHTHDLEAATFRLDIDHSAPAVSCIRLGRITTSAHGVGSYANILDQATDVVLPVHLLVERGKHATVPDRNADGAYTPGFDVNVNARDAWGVRDALGTKRRLPLAPNYSAWMTDTRSVAGKLGLRDDAQGTEGYSLRHSLELAVCGADGARSERELADALSLSRRDGESWDDAFMRSAGTVSVSSLLGYVRQRSFCKATCIEGKNPVCSPSDLWVYRPVSSVLMSVLVPAFAYDSGPGHSITSLGWALDSGNEGFLFWRFSRLARSLSPRPRSRGDDAVIYQIGGYYTPASSRWFDWYAGLGGEFEKETDHERRRRTFIEGGAKVRMFDKFGLLGIRVGVRVSFDRRQLDRPRVVTDIGGFIF